MSKAKSGLKTIKIDWKNPDIYGIVRTRWDNLRDLRREPEQLREVRAYYAAGNYADFISDWGVTYDPRNAERGLPTLIPFILFERQREWIDWVLRRWKMQRSGLCEKSRDMGITWEAIGLACTMCLFNEGVSVGFGSRKTEYVDKIGTYKPILPKGRIFMENLPPEFRGGYVPWRDSPFMRIVFPDTGSIIAGEGGDDIGRGDRTSVYFLDEAAHHPRQELVEASLSQTTNCRIDLSSVRGMNNLFAQKRWGHKSDDDYVFIFDWHEDPRKDQAWYDKQREELDQIVVAQEIDRDYGASVKGIVIPNAWVKAAIGAAAKIGIAPSGKESLSFDVADEGDDKNATCRAKGIEVIETDEWSGKGSDIFQSTQLVFMMCDDHKYTEFRFDEDGMGAGVRGDANSINQRRKESKQRSIKAIGYRGSGKVVDPTGYVEGTFGLEGDEARTNEDYYANHKAQAWGTLRKMFLNTYRWVLHIDTKGAEGATCNPDEIISLNPGNPNLMKLVAEISQATWQQNNLGKMVVDKSPNGMKSPNMADSVVIHYAPMEQEPVIFTTDHVNQAAAAPRRRMG